MSAHRYWRLLFRANNNAGGTNFTGVREVEFRTSIGGADVTGSGTAASDSNGAGTAANAFDNASTEWASGSGAFPHWLSYDFGAGNAKDIVEVSITSRTSATQSPTDFDLQYSDDNSSWTTLYSIQDSNWGAVTTNVYNASSHPTLGISTSKRFWRVQCSAADGTGNTLAIAEMEMFLATDGSGTDLCSGGTAFSQTTFIETPIPAAARAFDESASTYAATGSSGTIGTVLPWIGYLFASAQDVKSISIKARTDLGTSQQHQSPKNFTIQYWDGSAFQTFATLTNVTGWTSGQKRYFAASGEISAPSAAAARPSVFIVC